MQIVPNINTSFKSGVGTLAYSAFSAFTPSGYVDKAHVVFQSVNRTMQVIPYM